MTVLQVETLETSFAASLRHDIIAGIIPGGTELRSRELAVRFGISSSPVLAGLKRLEAEGFVTVNARRGVVVAVLSPEDVEELTVMRVAIERYAVEIAVPLATDATIRAMRRRLHETKSLLEVGPADAYELFELDRQFHMALYEATGRPTLVLKIQQLRERAMAYMVTAELEVALHQVESDQVHEAVVEAVTRKDSTAAAQLIVDHITALRQRVLPILRQRERVAEASSQA
jgi:DNA-binding GntR family transcriptional regulator